MLWINPDQYPSYEALNEDTNVDTTISNAIDTNQMANGWDGARQQDINKVLNFSEYIDQSFGGEMQPEEMIGWSTGIIPMFVSRGDFMGGTIQPAQIDALYASQQYGDVGLSNRNEVVTQQVVTAPNVFTPLDNQAAITFVSPGFEGEINPNVGWSNWKTNR